MPTEIYETSIVLTHWGRTGAEHQSMSAYWADNYNDRLVWPGYQERDWRELYKGHACFTPGKHMGPPLPRAVNEYGNMPPMRDRAALFARALFLLSLLMRLFPPCG